MSAGTTITAGDVGGTLDAVTLDGILDMTQNHGSFGVNATVVNGLDLNGTVELGSASGMNYAHLYFGNNTDNTPQTISGTGTIQFGHGAYNVLQNNSNETLTIGPNITIQVPGSNGYIDPFLRRDQQRGNDRRQQLTLYRLYKFNRYVHKLGTVLIGRGDTLNVSQYGSLPVPYTQSAGTTTVDGTLQVVEDAGTGPINLNGGVLDGSGTLHGNVTNAGAVNPGDDGTGTLTIDGNYTQTAAGTLAIEPRRQHARTASSRCRALPADGALSVSTVDNFVPGAPISSSSDLRPRVRQLRHDGRAGALRRR